MIYMVDIDGVICTNTNGAYTQAEPIRENIKKVNQLFERGHTIILWTARGSLSGIDWSQETKAQMEKWGVKHTELRLGKPHYDYWIDDKAVKL